MYGGFEGYSGAAETSLGQRDPVTNVTILSGNIGNQGHHTDNAYHVVTADGSSTSITVATWLDGFTITRGYAIDAPDTIECGVGHDLPAEGGAGLDIFKASPTIRNCIFQNNVAGAGGGGGHSHSLLGQRSSHRQLPFSRQHRKERRLRQWWRHFLDV